MLLCDALNAENAAINQLGVEQNVLAVNSFGFERENNVEICFGQRIGVYVHIDVDRRSLFAWAQRQRRAWAFKGKILDVLGQNVEGRLGGCAIAVLYFARSGLIAHYRYAFSLIIYLVAQKAVMLG